MGTKGAVIFSIDEVNGFLLSLESTIKAELGKPDVLLNYPTVYIHGWKSKANNAGGKYDVYVGESNDVIQRTKEHYQNASDPKKWQHNLVAPGVTPRLFIVGHPHFNKSLTLDIENRLMNYVLGMPNVRNVHNGRGNPQRSYYCSDEFEGFLRKYGPHFVEKTKSCFCLNRKSRILPSLKLLRFINLPMIKTKPRT